MGTPPAVKQPPAPRDFTADFIRDPARYPDRLDVTRSTTGDLAFSHGLHRCLGAPLARLEGQVVLRRLFERFPRLRLAVEPSDLRWRFSIPMRGLEELPVLLT